MVCCVLWCDLPIHLRKHLWYCIQWCTKVIWYPEPFNFWQPPISAIVMKGNFFSVWWRGPLILIVPFPSPSFTSSIHLYILLNVMLVYSLLQSNILLTNLSLDHPDPLITVQDSDPQIIGLSHCSDSVMPSLNLFTALPSAPQNRQVPYLLSLQLFNLFLLFLLHILVGSCQCLSGSATRYSKKVSCFLRCLHFSPLQSVMLGIPSQKSCPLCFL